MRLTHFLRCGYIATYSTSAGAQNDLSFVALISSLGNLATILRQPATHVPPTSLDVKMESSRARHSTEGAKLQGILPGTMSLCMHGTGGGRRDPEAG